MTHLSQLRDTLRADLLTSTERGKLIRSAGMTAGLKLGAAILAFGASLLYARVLGPHDYGLYAYVIAWAAVLTLPVGLGLPPYLVREAAKAPAALRNLCRWADARVLTSGLAAAAIMAAAFFLPYAAGARWLFLIAAPLPLLNNLGSIRRALLQAQGWIVRGQWPVLLAAPGLMLVALVVLWLWQGKLYPIELMIAMTGSALVPFVVNEFQFRRAALAPSNGAAPTVRIRAALPFMWLGMLYLLNNRTDLIMLGALKGAHAAGIYSVAARAAEFVTFFLTAANMVIAPRVARLFQEGERALLQRLISSAAWRILSVSIPVALLFIVAARTLLTYLYGAEYAEGAIALRILAAAQLVSVAVGPTASILNMTGHEKLSALGVGLSVVLNIVLNAVLIPLYGVKGAAFATGISLVACNTLLWYWIRRHLGLRPSGLQF